MQDEEGGPKVPGREGPTSFAGLHLGAGRAGLGRQRGSSGSLLSLLHTKEGRRDVLSALAGERDGGASGGNLFINSISHLQSERPEPEVCTALCDSKGQIVRGPQLLIYVLTPARCSYVLCRTKYKPLCSCARSLAKKWALMDIHAHYSRKHPPQAVQSMTMLQSS